MNQDILIASEDLLKRLDKIEKFGKRYGALPYQQVDKIIDEMRKLADSLTESESPQNQDQLIQSELKRRLLGEAFTLEQRITSRHPDFDTIVSIYAIPESDIRGLRGWLVANREKTQEAIERTYQTRDVKNYELDLPADIPVIRRQAEEVAAVHIQKYHKRIGKLLQELTKVGGFLRDIDAVPTTEEKSYFHPLTNTLAIGIPAICFTTGYYRCFKPGMAIYGWGQGPV